MGIELAKAFVTVRGDMSRVGKDISGGRNKVIGPLRAIASQSIGIMASIGAPIAAGAVFSKLISEGEEFNRKMRGSLAIMGRVSTALRNDMRQATFDVARTTQFSASQAAESFFFLASAGLDATQSVKAMPQVAKFAQAGLFDMATATDLATDAQSALGLTSKDAAENLENLRRVTDVFVRANTLANTSVQQIAEAMTNKAGAAARNAGLSIEEAAGVLAVFADQGLKGAAAGTALDIILRELQNKAQENAEAFRDAKVDVFDTNGALRSMSDIIAALETRLDGMSTQQRNAELTTLGFNRQSLSLIQTLLGTSDQIDKYTKALQNAGGATEEIADKQLTSMQKAINEVSAAFSELSDTLNRMVVSGGAKMFSNWLKDVRGGLEVLKAAAKGEGLTFEEIFGDPQDEQRRQDVLKRLQDRAKSQDATVDFSRDPTFPEGARDLFGLGKQVATGVAGAFQDAGKEMSGRRINEVVGDTLSSAISGLGQFLKSDADKLFFGEEVGTGIGQVARNLEGVFQKVGAGAGVLEEEFKRQKEIEKATAGRQTVPTRVGAGALGRSIQDRLLGNHQAKAANELEKQTPLLKRLVDLMQGEGSTTATLG